MKIRQTDWLLPTKWSFENKMRKDIPLLLTMSMFMNSCAPAVAKALKESNSDGSQKLAEEIPPITFTPNPTQIPTEFPYILEIPTQTPEIIIPVDILYFSQLNYKNEYFKDKSPWSFSGCSLMVGAMLDKTNPRIYYSDFVRILKEVDIDGSEMITENGSDLKHHRFVLERLGHTFVEIPAADGNLDEIKNGIREYTEQGIPVLIRAKLWTGFAMFGHYSIAVGVSEDGKIFYNDPVYGQDVLIPESAEDAAQMGTNHWLLPYEAYAVYPPNK